MEANRMHYQLIRDITDIDQAISTYLSAADVRSFVRCIEKCSLQAVLWLPVPLACPARRYVASHRTGK
jgi:hypothetical protein